MTEVTERDGLDGRTTLTEVFAATRATATGELNDAEFRFWMMVRSMESADRGCYADTEYLVMLLRKSESHIRKVRPSLVRKGWLEVVQRGRRAPELRAVVPLKGVHKNEPRDPQGCTRMNPESPGVHLGVHSEELSPTPPIEESTGSTEKTLEEISEKRSRYTPEQLPIIDSAFADFRSTRKTGRISASVVLREFKWWEGHEPGRVVAGLSTYVEKNYAAEGKDEKYARGIIRRQVNSSPVPRSGPAPYTAERAPRV